jgi:hypothetical protein
MFTSDADWVNANGKTTKGTEMAGADHARVLVKQAKRLKPGKPMSGGIPVVPQSLTALMPQQAPLKAAVKKLNLQVIMKINR